MVTVTEPQGLGPGLTDFHLLNIVSDWKMKIDFMHGFQCNEFLLKLSKEKKNVKPSYFCFLPPSLKFFN